MTINCNVQEDLQEMYLDKRAGFRDDLAKWKIYMKLVAPQLPDLTPFTTQKDAAAWLNSYSWPPTLSLPFDRLLKDEVTLLFEEAGWIQTVDRINDDKDAMYTTFVPPEPPTDSNTWSFSVNYHVHMTGSACKRVKVGTKMCEIAVYETRCKDDIADRELVAA